MWLLWIRLIRVKGRITCQLPEIFNFFSRGTHASTSYSSIDSKATHRWWRVLLRRVILHCNEALEAEICHTLIFGPFFFCLFFFGFWFELIFYGSAVLKPGKSISSQAPKWLVILKTISWSWHFPLSPIPIFFFLGIFLFLLKEYPFCPRLWNNLYFCHSQNSQIILINFFGISSIDMSKPFLGIIKDNSQIFLFSFCPSGFLRSKCYLSLLASPQPFWSLFTVHIIAPWKNST